MNARDIKRLKSNHSNRSLADRQSVISGKQKVITRGTTFLLAAVLTCETVMGINAQAYSIKEIAGDATSKISKTAKGVGKTANEVGKSAKDGAGKAGAICNQPLRYSMVPLT